MPVRSSKFGRARPACAAPFTAYLNQVTFAEAIVYLQSLQQFGFQPGLETTRRLASRVGNPHEHLQFIHVAGTNGKGSVCAFLESVYRTSGRRVGLYTSPHLVHFGERIQVDRVPIPELELARLTTLLHAAVQAANADLLEMASDVPFQPAEGRQGGTNPAGPHPSVGSSSHPEPILPSRDDTERRASLTPTLFEFTTVLALLWFLEQKVELVIWETGLGGRWDATNIVTPLASVITNIALDHQLVLGANTVAIAGEKAGIIKPGVPVLTATDDVDARSVIEGRARELDAPYFAVGPAAVADCRFALGLLGAHQRVNATLATATVRWLRTLLPVRDDQLAQGLANVRWSGRLQRIQLGSQTLLLDGAHNLAGITALRAALTEYFPDQRPTLVLGMLRDKDWRAMVQRLVPFAGRIVTAPVRSPRTVSAPDLRAACLEGGAAQPVESAESLAAALKACEKDPFVVVSGSLYFIGEALELLGVEATSTHLDQRLNDWSAPGVSVGRIANVHEGSAVPEAQ